jgi:hypothetical protein
MKRMTWGLVAIVALALVAPRAARAQGFAWMPLSVPEMAAHGATHMAVFTQDSFTETATNTATSFTNAVAAGIAVEFVKAVLDVPFNLGVGNTNWTGSVVMRVGDGSTTDLFLGDMELSADGTEVYAKWPPLTGYTVASTLQTNATVSAVAHTLQTNNYTVSVAQTIQTNTVVSAVSTLTTEFITDVSLTLQKDGDNVTNVVVNLQRVNGVTNLTVTSGAVESVQGISPTGNQLISVASVTPTVGNVVSVSGVTGAATGAEAGRKYYSSAGHLVVRFTPNTEGALASNTAGQVRLFFRQTQTKR